MGRVAKLYQRLDTLEADLVRQLVRHLTACADGRKELVLCAREFLPAHYPGNMPTGVADELLGQVEQIRRLRVQVGEPFERSLAWRYRECCRRWADHSDPHRGSAQTIAKRLLAEIVTGSSGGAAEPGAAADRAGTGRSRGV
jgi:hypothetical protein